jgi:hypothetical protein
MNKMKKKTEIHRLNAGEQKHRHSKEIGRKLNPSPREPPVQSLAKGKGKKP